MRMIEIKDNMDVWVLHHSDPTAKIPEFRFVIPALDLSPREEERFQYNYLADADIDCHMSYETKSHV